MTVQELIEALQELAKYDPTLPVVIDGIGEEGCAIPAQLPRLGLYDNADLYGFVTPKSEVKAHTKGHPCIIL